VHAPPNHQPAAAAPATDTAPGGPPGSLADRLGEPLARPLPITATSVVAITGLIVMAVVMVGLGLLLVHVLLTAVSAGGTSA
jgi:hypothetical protein